MVDEADKLDALARVGRALADPTRCRLLLVLLDGPAYPAELATALGLSKASVSNHLACARGCGLVVGTPEGRRVRYELAHPGLAHALNDLLSVVLDADPVSVCPPTVSGPVLAAEVSGRAHSASRGLAEHGPFLPSQLLVHK